MRKTLLISLIGLLLMSSCASGPIKKNKDGVTVKLQQESPTDTRLVRLSVLNEKIIRVSATPDEKFADKESLVVVPQTKDVKFEVIESDSTVTVATSCMSASVNLSNGQVVFRDSIGKILAAEDPNGRSFKPIEVEGSKG